MEGKVAIVTGASSGIGRGIAIELARSGCNIAIAARRIQQLEVTKNMIAEACKNGTVDIVCIPTDVTVKEAMLHCVAIAEDTLGPIDILVNNAGVMYFELMKNVRWDDWERTVNVNCKGVMYGIGSVLPQMISRGSGHIINITSDAGVTAFAGLGIYSGSKFFVEGMSKALRLETASTGIRVTCISLVTWRHRCLRLQATRKALKCTESLVGRKFWSQPILDVLLFTPQRNQNGVR